MILRIKVWNLAFKIEHLHSLFFKKSFSFLLVRLFISLDFLIEIVNQTRFIFILMISFIDLPSVLFDYIFMISRKSFQFLRSSLKLIPNTLFLTL